MSSFIKHARIIILWLAFKCCAYRNGLILIECTYDSSNIKLNLIGRNVKLNVNVIYMITSLV